MLRTLINLWPLKILGPYRFLPIFFVFGASLEFVMIKWEFKGTNFYKTFKRRRAEDIVAEEMKLKELYEKMNNSTL